MSRWTCALVMMMACEASPAPVTRRVPDKQQLYGDPGLVPTRAGERAREELARAASVTAALRARAGQGPLAVEVRLPTGDDPGAAMVAGALALDAASVVRITEGVLGPWSAGRVQVELGAEASAADPGAVRGPGWDATKQDAAGSASGAPGERAWQSWLLALALLGLGVSAGISIERLRQRRR